MEEEEEAPDVRIEEDGGKEEIEEEKVTLEKQGGKAQTPTAVPVSTCRISALSREVKREASLALLCLRC